MSQRAACRPHSHLAWVYLIVGVRRHVARVPAAKPQQAGGRHRQASAGGTCREGAAAILPTPQPNPNPCPPIARMRRDDGTRMLPLHCLGLLQPLLQLLPQLVACRQGNDRGHHTGCEPRCDVTSTDLLQPPAACWRGISRQPRSNLPKELYHEPAWVARRTRGIRSGATYGARAAAEGAGAAGPARSYARRGPLRFLPRTSSHYPSCSRGCLGLLGLRGVGVGRRPERGAEAGVQAWVRSGASAAIAGSITSENRPAGCQHEALDIFMRTVGSWPAFIVIAHLLPPVHCFRSLRGSGTLTARSPVPSSRAAPSFVPPSSRPR